MPRRQVPVLCLLLTVLVVLPAFAQAPQKPLANDDVVQMVKSKLPESTIINMIRASPSSFDISVTAMIALQQAGVSERIMNAVVEAGKRNTARSPATSAPSTGGGSARASVAPSAYQPAVVLVQGEARQNLPLERTKQVQTTAKPKSLGALAADRTMEQALRTSLSEGIGRTVGSSSIGQIIRAPVDVAIPGASGKGKPKNVTYVWAVSGAQSQVVLASDTPNFDVSIGGTRGVRPADYLPVVVKLTPTSNGVRLVGATEGKQNAGSTSAVDWPLYSAFMEERVPAQVESVAPGAWKLAVPAPLLPGEYALVFRPVSKSKQFAGQDIARNQGDGLLFNAVWSFSVR